MAVDIYTIVTSTTALEGSTLSESENRLLLDQGVSSFGKTISEQLLNLNAKKAYDLAKTMADTHEFWSPYRIRQLSDLAIPDSSAKISSEAELNKVCIYANEVRRHIRNMSVEDRYRASFEIHFGISRLPFWPKHNDMMARLLMNLYQREAGIDSTVIGPRRAEEYKKILAVAVDEDIADVFVGYMMAHVGDKVDIYKGGTAIDAKTLQQLQGMQTQAVPEYKPRVRGATREKILKLLRKHPFMSALDISKELGISDKAVEKQISILKKNGELQRVGPDKGGRWVVTNKANA